MSDEAKKDLVRALTNWLMDSDFGCPYPSCEGRNCGGCMQPIAEKMADEVGERLYEMAREVGLTEGD